MLYLNSRWYFLLTLEDIEFNFNKCCIWIIYMAAPVPNQEIFNFNKCCIWIYINIFLLLLLYHLTLTSVVFEFCKVFFISASRYNLTLTSVVFEFNPDAKNYIWLPWFNFNKCCIWIFYLHLPYDLARQFNFNKCCIWII